MFRKSLTLPLTLAALSSVITAHADLKITEVMPQTTAGTVNTINGDWWELTNSGSVGIDLAGYQWADTEDALGGPTPQPNLFPSFTIAPGQSIIILEETSANEAAWRTNWGIAASVPILGSDEMLPSPGVTDTFSGLGSGGDGVFFYSPSGDLLSQYAYAASVRGTTFEADKTGIDLGLSVIGENGAVQAANRDIGSPGSAITAVPEPGAWLLGVAAAIPGLSLLRRRRR